MSNPNIIHEDEIDLLELWYILVKNKIIIFSTFFVLVLISALYAFLSPPIYRAEVLLAPAQEENDKLSSLASQYGGLASLAGINLGASGSNKTDESIAILKSRSFLFDFISHEKILQALYKDDWDEKKQKWIVNPEDVPTLHDGYEVVTEDIVTVNVDKETGLIDLSVEWKDSVLATSWANKLVKQLNLYQKDREVDEANKSLKFLNTQLESTTSVENRKVLFNLIEHHTQTILLANVTDEFAFKVLDPAIVPEKKVKPKRSLIIVVGGFTGLIIGVFLAFIKEFLFKHRNN